MRFAVFALVGELLGRNATRWVRQCQSTSSQPVPERAGPTLGGETVTQAPGSSGRSRRRGTSAPAGSPATDRRRPRRGRAEQQLAHPLLPDPRRCAPMASNWVEAVNRMVSALAPTRYGPQGLGPQGARRSLPHHKITSIGVSTVSGDCQHQRRFTRLQRPALPSPVIPGWNENPWA